MDTWDKVLRRNAQRLRQDVARQASGERILRHVPTGFLKIDNKFGGVRLGVVTELLAHTGDGKSAFIRQCAEGCARAGGGALLIMGEDPEDATAERQLAGDTGIDTTELGRLDLSAAQLDDLDRAAAGSREWARLVLPTFGHMDIDEVLAFIDENPRVGGAPVRGVYLDYAQVFGTTRNLEDDIRRMGEELRDRAERGFAIMIASQVANDVVKRGRDAWFNKRDASQIRPSIGDTEWCKALEKSSKAVWSLVRPGRWQREWGEDVEDNTAELHIVKQNFGSMGWAELGWHGPTTRFLNV